MEEEYRFEDMAVAITGIVVVMPTENAEGVVWWSCRWVFEVHGAGACWCGGMAIRATDPAECIVARAFTRAMAYVAAVVAKWCRSGSVGGPCVVGS